MRWLLILFVMLSPSNAQAAVIFSENFEVTPGFIVSGQQTATDLAAKGWGFSGGTSDIVTAARPGSSGTRALRQDYIGVHVNDNNNSKLFRSFSSQSEIWEKYWLRFVPIDLTQPFGFTQITSKQHYLKVDNGPNVSGLPNFVTDFFFNNPRLGTASQKPTTQTCPNGSVGTTCNINANLANVPMNDQQWHCVETHHKFNTAGVADGVVEIWIDGTKTLNITNGRWRETGTTATTSFTNMEIYRQGGDNMYRFEDDYVLATTRTEAGGCGAPTAGDTTPPSAVPNFVVQ